METSLATEKLLKGFGFIFLYASLVPAPNVLEELTGPRTRGGKVIQERRSLSLQQGQSVVVSASPGS